MESIRHALFKGTVINLLARVMGYLKYVLIAIYMGFTLETDAFFLAMAIIGFLGVFSNALESVGVPQLTQARLRNDQTAYQAIFSRHFTATLVVLLSIVVLFLVLIPLLFNLPKNFSPEKQALYETFLLLLFPYALLATLLQFFGGILRSLRRFSQLFLCELLASSTIVITLWVGFYHHIEHILVWAHLIGITLAVALAYVFTRKHITFQLSRLSDSVEYVKRIYLVALIAGTFTIMGMVDKYFGTYLPDKYITALTYGLLLASAPVNTLRIHNFTITWLSEGHLNMTNLFRITALIIMLGTAIAIVSWWILPYVVDLVFGYGQFASLDHQLLVEAARFYFLSLPFLLLWPILYQSFQIRENLRPVFLIGSGAVLINYLLNDYFINHLGWMIEGITLGTFFSYLFMTGAGLFALWQLEKRHEPEKA